MTCVLLPAVRSGIPGVCHTFGIFPDGGKLEMSTSLEAPGWSSIKSCNIWFNLFSWIPLRIPTPAQPNSTHRSVLKACWIACSRNTWPSERNGKKKCLAAFIKNQWYGRVARKSKECVKQSWWNAHQLEDQQGWWYWTLMTNQFYGFDFLMADHFL